VPVTLAGWRVWDLFEARDLHPHALTRGILVVVDRSGVVVPETDRQVTASELGMILEVFGDHSLAFHISTRADENRIPVLLDKLVARYPALRGRTIQPINQLRPDTCEELIPVKEKHALRVIVPHYTMYGADAWAPAVSLADQVLFDAGNGRGIQALNLDERTVDALRLVVDICRAPIGLAGRLTAESVTDLALRLHEVRAQLERPFALCGDAPLRSDASLDLPRSGRFFDACTRVLGLAATAGAVHEAEPAAVSESA
jgi:hypothetical protein